MKIDDRYRVRSLERALDVLEALGQSGRAGLSVSELSRRAAMSKSNSFSILQTLIARGYVADEGVGLTRRYRLTPALAQLTEGVLRDDSVTTIGQKILESLTAETGLTSRLAVLDDGYVVALLRVDGPGPVRLSTYLGRRPDWQRRCGTGHDHPGELSARHSGHGFPSSGCCLDICTSGRTYSPKVVRTLSSNSWTGIVSVGWDDGWRAPPNPLTSASHAHTRSSPVDAGRRHRDQT